jgi:NarL family two-component system response regulator YdfI
VTRVFVIGPSLNGRERLEELLDTPGVEIVGRADSVVNALEEYPEDADVFLIDAANEPLEELQIDLRESGLLRDAQVVLLAEAPSLVAVNQAIRAGVRGILPPDVDAEQLVKALEAVGQGLVVLHPREIQAERAPRTAGDSLEAVESLTPREREVLQMLARGLGNKEIATRLKISEHTAKFHVASILGKLGASTRTEAVSVALRMGLILL